MQITQLPSACVQMIYPPPPPPPKSITQLPSVCVQMIYPTPPPPKSITQLPSVCVQMIYPTPPPPPKSITQLPSVCVQMIYPTPPPKSITQLPSVCVQMIYPTPPPPSQLPSYHQYVYKWSTLPPVNTQHGCRLSNYQHASKLPQNYVNHTAVGKFRNTYGQEPKSKEKTHKLQNKSAPKKANNIKLCTADSVLKADSSSRQAIKKYKSAHKHFDPVCIRPRWGQTLHKHFDPVRIRPWWGQTLHKQIGRVHHQRTYWQMAKIMQGFNTTQAARNQVVSPTSSAYGGLMHDTGWQLKNTKRHKK